MVVVNTRVKEGGRGQVAFICIYCKFNLTYLSFCPIYIGQNLDPARIVVVTPIWIV